MAHVSSRPSMIVGSAAESVLQGEGLGSLPGSGRAIRLATVTQIRWIGLTCQALLLAAAVLLFDLHPPVLACGAVIAFGAAVNLGASLAGQRGRLLSHTEATLQLGFDVLELTVQFYLTGGVIDPFSMLLIAPVTLAAWSLPWRNSVSLAVLTIVCAAGLVIWSRPAPWIAEGSFVAPLVYRLAAAAAVIGAVMFTAGYAWLAARQAGRMELALHVTQAVLAREQRLSALGGLAAAAAHELGTPLATIAVVAKELAREGPEEVREDARLLLSQTERCREILRRLTETPEAEDEVHARMSLVQLLHEVIEPHANAKVRVEAVVTGPPAEGAPHVRRMPEVLRAMTSLVDNAVDFAAAEVLLTARFDHTHVSIEVRDDGPGFSADVLSKLGQPYITSRPAGEGSRSEHAGMGLGFFIAKTLLERTGATLEFKNGKGGGAIVAARWPRDKVEAPQTG